MIKCGSRFFSMTRHVYYLTPGPYSCPKEEDDPGCMSVSGRWFLELKEEDQNIARFKTGQTKMQPFIF